jgi:hypothetical protein
MNRRVEFELPGLPKMTNPSGAKSTHWTVLKREADLWKREVGLSARGRFAGQAMRRAKLTLTRFSSRAPDSDGLVSGFKHVIDGLVLAGVLENDKYENIGMPDYRWQKWPRGKGKIRVIVEEVEN